MRALQEKKSRPREKRPAEIGMVGEPWSRPDSIYMAGGAVPHMQVLLVTLSSRIVQRVVPGGLCRLPDAFLVEPSMVTNTR